MAKVEAITPMIAAMKRRGDIIHTAAETIKKMYDMNLPELVAQVRAECTHLYLCSMMIHLNALCVPMCYSN